MEDLKENSPSPEDADSDGNIKESKLPPEEKEENSPEVQRELNKMRFKDYLKDYWGRALIVFVPFGAFAILLVKTQHRDDFTFWIMIGIGGIAVIFAAVNIIDMFLRRYEKKRVFRSFRNAVMLIAVSIIFFGIALCSYLPAGNVMLTASMLIAASALLFAVTILLKNFELIGNGRFKNLSRKRKTGVVSIYVIESLLAAGAIVGGVFFMLQVSLPLLAVGVVFFFILLIPLTNNRQ